MPKSLMTTVIDRPDVIGRRKFMKSGLALVGAGFLMPSLSTKSALAQTPVKGGILSLGITGSVTDRLDPATWTGHAMPTFGKTWGETLVEPDPVDKSPVPVLAETWEADEAAKIWTFTLRQGVTFHNGQPMTSEDVVKTLRRHSDEKSQSAALGALGDIASIDADGPGKVVVRLKSGNLDLPLLLSDYHLIIQPGGGVDKPDAGIGTGPYRVVSVEAGIKYVSEKVLGHWREDVGHVDRIEMMIINDDTARLSALRSGRVHMINQVDPKTAKLLERVGKVSVENTQGGGHYTFSMRTDIAPFDNADLRLAMKYAIDRSELVERILQGYGTVGNDYPINATYPMAPEEIEQRGYDPELARRHFVKSGHKGPVTLHVSDAAFAGAVDAAVLFQASAARAGIEIDVQRVPADGYWSDVWNKVPFSASYWTSRPVQDHIYSTAYMSGLPWNETHWSRPDFDDLVLAARIEADPVKRQKLFKDMALMVRNEGGVIIPMFNDFIDAVSDEVGGYIKDTSGPLSNYFAPIRCWLGTSL